MFDLFPRLKERLKQGGWSLSGGEQQMLAIGRALMGRPSLLMLDEPSLGLAPIVIEQVFDRILELNKRTGLGVLLVEQNSAMALEIASRAFVLETGAITLSGPSADACRRSAHSRSLSRRLTCAEFKRVARACHSARLRTETAAGGRFACPCNCRGIRTSLPATP